MNRPFEVITFDCYGTLIDWEQGIVRAFLEAAAQDGLELEPEEIVRVYSEVEPEVEGGVFTTYRHVLAEAAVETAARLGWTITPMRATFLAESLPFWEPFPDTNPALSRLAAAGYRLGILSNVDDDLLTATRRHFPVSFDVVVTAEQVMSYKPAHGHFLEARRRIGARPWLHVAQSYFHDVAPAWDLAVPVVWINRKGEPAPGKAHPLAVLRDLEGLDRWLETTRYRASGHTPA